MNLIKRPRRNRKNQGIRELVSENSLSNKDLVLPLFVSDSLKKPEEIKSMPGVFCHTKDSILSICEQAVEHKINAVALFPRIADEKKDSQASEALNVNGLIPTTVREIKKNFPHLNVITDIALDPFSSDGHDGLVRDGKILNDETLNLLSQMAVLHATSGADIVAPSDMMDGRVIAVREALDKVSFEDVSILSYSAKYCSNFYGPFRDALASGPRVGNKKTYQMDPANSREALLEASLDIDEGADIIMVKPALCYLDVILKLRESFQTPICAYLVSGESSMLKAASLNGWLDFDEALIEVLVSIKRAGADFIFCYYALDAISYLESR